MDQRSWLVGGCSMFCRQQNQQRPVRSLCRVVETGQPHDYELPYESDGIRGWFRNMAVKLGDGIAVYFNEITARKRVETERAALFAAVQKNHEDLLSILDQLPQGIVMTDREGRITFANRGCQCFLGDKVDSAYGRQWMELCRSGRRTRRRWRR